MATTGTAGAARFVPDERTLAGLVEAIKSCHGCDLYRNATQPVFGELMKETRAKRPGAAIMMIGEQPGDHEDKEGHPFVGPAGKMLDQCLEQAKIDRRKVYVTNAVKHFRGGAARQAAHPQEAQHAGDPCLQALAGCRT
jgi:uracil-DNA glycosylase family 4